MISPSKFFKEWSTEKGHYEIFDGATGEMVNDTISEYDKVNIEVARLNQEARRAAGGRDEIELPPAYYGSKRGLDIPVSAPTIHK